MLAALRTNFRLTCFLLFLTHFALPGLAAPGQDLVSVQAELAPSSLGADWHWSRQYQPDSPIYSGYPTSQHALFDNQIEVALFPSDQVSWEAGSELIARQPLAGPPNYSRSWVDHFEYYRRSSAKLELQLTVEAIPMDSGDFDCTIWTGSTVPGTGSQQEETAEVSRVRVPFGQCVALRGFFRREDYRPCFAFLPTLGEVFRHQDHEPIFLINLRRLSKLDQAATGIAMVKQVPRPGWLSQRSLPSSLLTTRS